MTDEPIGFNDTPPALRATSKNRNRKKRTPLYIRHIVRAAQLANSEIAIKKALELKQIYHSGKHVTTDMADAVCNEVLMRCATKGNLMLEDEKLSPANLAFITGAVAQVKKAVSEKEKGAGGVNIQINFNSPVAEQGPVDIETIPEG